MLSPRKRIGIILIIVSLFTYTIYIDNVDADVSPEETIPNVDKVDTSALPEEMMSIATSEKTPENNDVTNRQTVALDISEPSNSSKDSFIESDKISIATPIEDSLERVNVAFSISDNDEKMEAEKPKQEFDTYTIKFNDNLWIIAKKCYGFINNSDIQKGVFAIAGANKDLQNINYLVIGKELRIPKGKNFEAYYHSYMSYLRMCRGTQLPTSHVVQLGETLSSIAKKYYNDSNQWLKIFQANPNTNSGALNEGTKLHIPK